MSHIQPINSWLKHSSPIIRILGPCSAESEDQVFRAAKIAKKHDASLFRAGLWKPRSRPDTFQGLGSYALPWLKHVQSRFGLQVCTEVANPHHVEMVLRAGIDAVWIGARTMANPFAVQEIAEAIHGTELPVMLKNPINPDLGLWRGGIERILQKSKGHILAIHRGFSMYNSVKYRNIPMWEIPIQLRQIFPDLKIICDASHIAGNHNLISQVLQTSINLDFDGYMIEVHPEPENAKSDSEQQLDEASLEKILSSLHHLNKNSQNPDFQANIEALRIDIDRLDSEILALLASRMDVVREIGRYKRDNHVTILQLERWKDILKNRFGSGNELQLTDQFIEELMTCIHKEAIRQQNKIMDERNN
jgi:chorismate mutase